MEKVCTVYLCDCKINKLQQSNVDFPVNTLINKCFHEKKNCYCSFLRQMSIEHFNWF